MKPLKRYFMAGTDRMIVQKRDREFLAVLPMLGLVDHEQAKLVAGFQSTSRANKRLLKLVRAGLLRRFFLGSGGGRKALYALSEKGARLVDVPMRGPRRPQGALLVADLFVEHQLAVNSIYCAARFEKPASPGVEFRRWMAFHEPVVPGLRLIPDGYVEFDTSAGVVAAFLEMDLGTEALAIWKEKTKKYLELALSGAFARIFGQDRFRVLVVAHSARRLESIRKAVAGVTEKIFRFATLENARNRFFGPVWLRPTGNQLESLFELKP
jgi:Replication-relaxation